MQILTTTEPVNGFEPGDIITVAPDDQSWGLEESLSEWTAAGRAAGLFPNPGFAIVVMPGEPPDLNLRDADPGTGAKRAWRVDLARLPADALAQLRGPGASATVDRIHRSVIVRKATGESLPFNFDDDGVTIHRNPATETRA